ncbi:MAG: hypothetical protein NTW82_06010 [Bacteroidia bacterium]|nr:hypothetical protein [Bacteroidia bacterium]
MRKIALIFIFSLIFYSCEKDNLLPENNNIIPEDEYNVHSIGKIKTQYNYSSSSDTIPYSFISYSYDEDWNLKRKLLSNYPNPVYASYTYEYSDKGVLLNKKFYAMEGQNYSDQTESDFSLIYIYKYSYVGNKIVEKRYIKNELTDSIIYSFANNLLMSEYDYSFENSTEWSIIYEYDSNKNKIKKIENPEGIYTIYTYEGSNIITTIEYDRNWSILVEITFTYSESDDKVIVESYYDGPYGDFISDKTTYKDGNVIEYIGYHPTKYGEWYCCRYEYYQ